MLSGHFLNAQVRIAIDLNGPLINGVCVANGGICDLTATQSSRYTENNWDCEGELYLDPHNNLILTIDKKSTSSFAKEIQFRDGFMDIEKPWKLSDDILNPLKENRSTNIIPPGKYIIMEFGNTYIVNFGNFLM